MIILHIIFNVLSINMLVICCRTSVEHQTLIVFNKMFLYYITLAYEARFVVYNTIVYFGIYHVLLKFYFSHLWNAIT